MDDAATNERAVRDDASCRAVACEYLDGLLLGVPDNACPGPAVCWDDRHHLQGHAHLGRVELVVIAPRDDRHEPLLLVEQDWDRIRRAAGDERPRLVDECAIRTPRRLRDVLSSH